MKVSVISAIYNEEVLLPQFLDYYCPQVDTVFLLDNESTDRSRFMACRYPNVVVSTYSSGKKFSDIALSEAYDRKRRECIGHFDVVILADCDEFVVPKSGVPIATAIEGAMASDQHGSSVEFLWTHGFNMWPRPEATPYDSARPLLSQLKTGIETHVYSKPCIIRPQSRLVYEHGRHEFRGNDVRKPTRCDNSPFSLLHYIGFDESTYVKRGMERTLRFSQDNVTMGTSRQYHQKSEEWYRNVFRANSNDSKLATVPIDWKALEGISSRRRLDIGSGVSPTPGHDTLDKNTYLKPNYSFDLLMPNWPIPAGTYDEVLAIHVLEHLPVSKVRHVLDQIRGIMKPGGTLRIHVPNGPLVARAYLEQPDQHFRIQMAIYGAEAETDPAFAHKALYDFSMLRTLLSGSGFEAVEDITNNYEDHHDPHWTWMGGRLSLKVSAKKPTTL